MISFSDRFSLGFLFAFGLEWRRFFATDQLNLFAYAKPKKKNETKFIHRSIDRSISDHYQVKYSEHIRSMLIIWWRTKINKREISLIINTVDHENRMKWEKDRLIESRLVSFFFHLSKELLIFFRLFVNVSSITWHNSIRSIRLIISSSVNTFTRILFFSLLFLVNQIDQRTSCFFFILLRFLMNLFNWLMIIRIDSSLTNVRQRFVTC